MLSESRMSSNAAVGRANLFHVKQFSSNLSPSNAESAFSAPKGRNIVSRETGFLQTVYISHLQRINDSKCAGFRLTARALARNVRGIWRGPAVPTFSGAGTV